VLDQGALNSCVAHALAYAAKAVRPEAPLLSRLFVYWAARSFHNESDRDEGTFLRAAFRVLAKLGFCPEELWPYATASVNTKPPWAAFKAAIDQRAEARYYRISRRLPGDVVADVRCAIAAGHPVVFGCDVARDFVSGRESTLHLGWRASEIAGGHAMALLAYDEDWFYGPNSWGPHWGESGWFRASPDFIGAAARDVWALVYTPHFSEAP
jgi:hypothetical protein